MNPAATLIVSLGFLVAACDRGPTDHELAEDILEQLALWGLTNAETDLRPPAAYCIGILDGPTDGPQDASPTFLARFESSRIPVVPLSKCRREADYERSERHAFIYPETGRHALAIFVGVVEHVGDGQATGSVLVVQGGLWGAGHRCTLQQVLPGQWEVTSCERALDI